MAEFKGRLRIAGRDIDGNLPIPKALRRIKGVGINFADSIAKVFFESTGVQPTEKIGTLDDNQIKIVEDILSSPTKHGIATYLINRRNDPETGEDTHLISSDLDFTIKQDKEKHMAIKSWRGVRFSAGLPVRGQRTRTMGRKGKTLGVQRKKKK